MNCTLFDDSIKKTFQQYGQLGVNVNLLTVSDPHSAQPPYDWVRVSVEVTQTTQDPKPRVDNWFYGGVIRNETAPVPDGIRTINKDKLIGSETAARKLPTGFDLETASCTLFWPLYPGSNEPIYVFYNDTTTYNVGAYTGKTMTMSF